MVLSIPPHPTIAKPFMLEVRALSCRRDCVQEILPAAGFAQDFSPDGFLSVGKYFIVGVVIGWEWDGISIENY